jgi:hypothetical protein
MSTLDEAKEIIVDLNQKLRTLGNRCTRKYNQLKSCECHAYERGVINVLAYVRAIVDRTSNDIEFSPDDFLAELDEFPRVFETRGKIRFSVPPLTQREKTHIATYH